MQEQSQEWWFSLGHSTVPKFWWPGEGSQVPPGSGQIPCSVKDTREQCFLLQKAQAWLYFCWQGHAFSLSVLSVRYLHISAQLTPEALPAPEANSCELQNKGDHPQGWGPPASSQPQRALEMPARGQGPHSTWDAFLLHRSFSICHGGAPQTLCSATCLPENVKAWYPHHLWNLAETNLSNQGRSAFGNKTKMV